MAGHVVIVLNFHGREDTLRCVDSLVSGSPEAAVLVVDNGSHDGTAAEVRRRWPQVATVEELKRIHGYVQRIHMWWS